MNDITLRQILKQELIALKENLFLVEFQDQKYILKGQRTKERNSLEKFRFNNELTFYKNVKQLNQKNEFLNVPRHYISSEPEMLVLEYISKVEEGSLPRKQFVKAYLEFQTLQVQKNILVGPYHQLINNFYYRIGVVSLRTISRKVSYIIALQAFMLMIKFSVIQKDLKSFYLIHGDLNNKNFLFDKNGKIFFIDFENIFYTRKWPIAEIFSKCFNFTLDNYIDFNPELLVLYLRELKKSEVELSYFLQCRFGLLFHSVKEIAQTKNANRKRKYIELLKISLNRKKYKDWYKIHLEEHLKKI